MCEGRGYRKSIFNAPEYHTSHKAIIEHRPALAWNSNPVSPLLFNLAYFMVEQKYQSPKPRQALYPLKIFLNMQHTSSPKILAFSLRKLSFISCIRMWNVYTNFAFYCPPYKITAQIQNWIVQKVTISKHSITTFQAPNKYISGIQ
jgi:hypothetical protein